MGAHRHVSIKGQTTFQNAGNTKQVMRNAPSQYLNRLQLSLPNTDSNEESHLTHLAHAPVTRRGGASKVGT